MGVLGYRRGGRETGALGYRRGAQRREHSDIDRALGYRRGHLDIDMGAERQGHLDIDVGQRWGHLDIDRQRDGGTRYRCGAERRVTRI